MNRKPDFIGIGAAKAGTTWLYEQLKAHPQIRMPHVKELHYFDHVNVKRYITLLSKKTIFGRHVRSALFFGLRPGRVLWTIRYLCSTRPHADYHKLFTTDPGLVAGEITPAYARLSAEIVQSIASYHPQCKILYILRNPVERLWSHANMIRMSQTRYKEASDEVIYNRLNDRQLAASGYLQNLEKWGDYFPEEQIFVGFYDELVEEPSRFMNRVCDFLQVDRFPEEGISKRLGAVFNKGKYSGFPVEIKQRITRELYPELVGLHEKFDNQYTSKWIQEANQLLAEHN